ncbi:MAG: (Fe-S)-binding protein [Candidatus Electronema sp. VV]
METGNSKETGCAKCGACMTVCSVFRAEGRESLTARGRLHLLAACSGPPSAALAEVFTRCLLCGACEQVCPRRLPITRLIAEARSRLPPLLAPGSLSKAAACAVLARPVLLDSLVKMGVSLKRLPFLPENSGLRLKLALAEECLMPDLPPPPESGQQRGDGLAYFVGCFARHLQPSIAAATLRLLGRCGMSAHIPAQQCCCGLAAWASGKTELARELARRNIAAFAGSGPVITSCASCSSHLLELPELFAEHDPWRARARSFAGRIQEFTVFFKERLPPDNAGGLRVFWHDPCHLRFRQEGMDSPRRLLRKMGFSLTEPEDGPRCCGQGGLFHLACPDTAEKILQRCISQTCAARPGCVTTTCSGCLMQLQQGFFVQGNKIRVAHLAVLLEEGGGGVNC